MHSRRIKGSLRSLKLRRYKTISKLSNVWPQLVLSYYSIPIVCHTVCRRAAFYLWTGPIALENYAVPYWLGHLTHGTGKSLLQNCVSSYSHLSLLVPSSWGGSFSVTAEELDSLVECLYAVHSSCTRSALGVHFWNPASFWRNSTAVLCTAL